MPRERRAAEACAHIAGTDIHPVAVIIARVTYLLALAPALSHRSGTLSIPVYLGDAMQLSISEFMAGKELTIRVPPPAAGEGGNGAENGNGREQLAFPETFCRDPALFDKAIERMRTGSLEGLSRAQIEAALSRITEQHYRADVTRRAEAGDRGSRPDLPRLRPAAARQARHDLGLRRAQPVAPARLFGRRRLGQRGDRQPALARLSPHEPGPCRNAFANWREDERVYVGGRFATQNDLCSLFLVRAAHLYLRSGGRLAFILPLAALTRGQFEHVAHRLVPIGQDRLGRSLDHGRHRSSRCFRFRPAPSSGASRRLRAASRRQYAPIPDGSRFETRRKPSPTSRLDSSPGRGAPAVGVFAGDRIIAKPSDREPRLVPRMLCLVERRQMGRLGADQSAPLVGKPPQRSGKATLEGPAGHREPGRGGVPSPGSPRREHLALSRVPAVRGRHTGQRKR